MESVRKIVTITKFIHQNHTQKKSNKLYFVLFSTFPNGNDTRYGFSGFLIPFFF